MELYDYTNLAMLIQVLIFSILGVLIASIAVLCFKKHNSSYYQEQKLHLKLMSSIFGALRSFLATYFIVFTINNLAKVGIHSTNIKMVKIFLSGTVLIMLAVL